MRTTGAISLRKVVPRATSSAELGSRRSLLLRQKLYNKLKHIIPGTTKTTPSHVLKTKLEKARSDPDMMVLMSRFEYRTILEVAKELVAKGLFSFARQPDSYTRAHKAAQEAASEPSLEENVPDEIRKSGFRRLELSQPAVTEADLPNSTSKTAITNFDQLLKEHLETARAASTASTVSHNSKPAEVHEFARSTDSIGELKRVKRIPRRIRLRNMVKGRYRSHPKTHLEEDQTHLEKVYQVLKPYLKGISYQHPGALQTLKDYTRDLSGHDIDDLKLEYGTNNLWVLAHHLASRGFFLVNFDKFPSYREAAGEARRLVLRYADQPLQTDGFASKDAIQLPSPDPWGSLRLPNMYDIEPAARRDTVPDFQKMRLLPAPEVSQGLNNNQSSNTTEVECIPIPSSRESASNQTQTTEPNAAALQIPHPGFPEIPEQVLNQDEMSTPAVLVKPQVTAHDRFGKPTKTLRVTGLRKRANEILLLKKFAKYSPVKIEVTKRLVVLITFVNIEAASKALHARHRFLLDGRTMLSRFVKDNLRNDQVQSPVVASRQLVNDRMCDMSSLPGDTWDEQPSADSTPVEGEAIVRAETDKTAGAVSKVPAQSIADKISLPSKPDLPDLVDTTSTEEESSKSNVEGPDDRLENKQFQDAVPAPTMSDDFETDEGTMSTKPSASIPLSSVSRWDALSDARDLKKDSNIDPVDSEIKRHATMAVPETQSFYLPHFVQHKILCGLQASLEKVCFEYIMRTSPNVLQETQNQWGVDNPHALELNQYIWLFVKLNAFGSKSVGPDNNKSMWKKLHQSLVLLRNVAVHRKRSSVPSLRRWTHDAYTLATMAGDSKAAAQFETLGRYLEVEQRRLYADRKEAEKRLLVTVKELAAKRAELDRLEQEAMNRFSEEHKEIHARNSADLSKAIDATLSLDSGLEFGCGKTSWTEPTSPIEPVSATEPASPTLSTTSPAELTTSLTELTTSTIEPTLSPTAPTLSPNAPTALSVERAILPAEPLSLVPSDKLSTDPVSGIFGRLKLWYGA